MAWKIELSRAAERALREATKTGWMEADRELEEAELVRARLVYDGAVTGDGYIRDKQS
jgi:hypothetical protein